MIFLAILTLACARSESPSQKAEATQPTAEVAAPAPPPPIEELTARLVKGLDVSSHNGSVDWRAVAAEGPGFVFIKATEGVDNKDVTFDDHWSTVKGTGLIRGAYHFYVTEDDPLEQARFYISNVALEPGDLAPMVDIELIGHGTHEGLATRFRTFLEALEAHYGMKPIIYTSPKFWDTHFGDGFGDYPLWVAEYGVSEPHLPVGWSRWHLWQFEDDAIVKGIEKSADLSRVNLSSIEPRALFYLGPPSR